jgi:integrase
MAGKRKQAGRHRNGEGSITKRADGRFQGSIMINGKRAYRYGKSYKEVQAALKQVQKEAERGVNVAAPQITLGTFLDEWLDAKRLTVEDTTHRRYTMLMVPIKKALGGVKLSKLDVPRLSAFFADMLEIWEPGTVKLAYTILKTALKDAVKWGRIAYNPLDKIDPIHAPEKEMQALDLEQAQRFIDQVEETHYFGRCIYIVGVTLGLRIGECLGIRWSDIDLDAGTLQINRGIVYMGSKTVVHEPKTRAGRRTIHMPEFLVEILREHRKEWIETRLQAAVWKVGNRLQVGIWKDSDLVFCRERDGGVMCDDTINRRLAKILKAADLPVITFHGLRHSAASILLAMGQSVKVVQEILGHANPAITLTVYGHVTPRIHREAMNDLDEVYNPVKHKKDNAK